MGQPPSPSHIELQFLAVEGVALDISEDPLVNPDRDAGFIPTLRVPWVVQVKHGALAVVVGLAQSRLAIGLMHTLANLL